MSETGPVLSVDLGGTKTVVALVSPDGKITDRHRQPTDAGDGPEVVVRRLFSGIDNLLAKNDTPPRRLTAISLGIAGIIDIKNGVVDKAPNLPGWENLPIGRLVNEKYGVPVYVLNDADAAALGEHRYGAGRGLKNIILVALGTGIGGGMVLDGRMFTGSSGSTFEIGHMVIKENGPDCGCGKKGCLETLVSGNAISREAKERLAKGDKSLLTDMTGGGTEEITSEKVHQAAKEGDALALRVISDAAHYLGLGIINLVSIINPEMVIIGGSVSDMGELLIGPVRNMVNEKVFPLMVKDLRIVRAELGEDGGLLGAAAYAFDRIHVIH